jgi:hypothetical protein
MFQLRLSTAQSVVTVLCYIHVTVRDGEAETYSKNTWVRIPTITVGKKYCKET